MSPPGLAFASVSKRAWERAEHASLPRYYLDWKRSADSQVKGDTAFTPAVSIVVALRTALDIILDRGAANVWEHNRRLARGARAGVKGLGLGLFSPDDDSAAMVTALLMPEGVDGQECYTVLRDRHGIVLAGGHGPLRGKIMRIGHMGYMNEFDIVTALAGLEMAHHELPDSLQLLAGVAGTALFAAGSASMDSVLVTRDRRRRRRLRDRFKVDRARLPPRAGDRIGATTA
jgi:aspartate aminotransferase-like enzyme